MANTSPIRQRMAELNISGPSLAEIIGVPYRTLDEFIRRKSGNYLLLQKIANALDTTMDALAVQDGNDIKTSGRVDSYDICRRVLEAYRAAINEELIESYRVEVLTRFSEIAWKFQSSQSETLLKFCEEGELDSFLDLYADILEIAPDMKYFVMDNLVRNIRAANKTERFDISTYFTLHGFEDEAKRIIE